MTLPVSSEVDMTEEENYKKEKQRKKLQAEQDR